MLYSKGLWWPFLCSCVQIHTPVAANAFFSMLADGRTGSSHSLGKMPFYVYVQWRPDYVSHSMCARTGVSGCKKPLSSSRPCCTTPNKSRFRTDKAIQVEQENYRMRNESAFRFEIFLSLFSGCATSRPALDSSRAANGSSNSQQQQQNGRNGVPVSNKVSMRDFDLLKVLGTGGKIM